MLPPDPFVLQHTQRLSRPPFHTSCGIHLLGEVTSNSAALKGLQEELPPRARTPSPGDLPRCQESDADRRGNAHLCSCSGFPRGSRVDHGVWQPALLLQPIARWNAHGRCVKAGCKEGGGKAKEGSTGEEGHWTRRFANLPFYSNLSLAGMLMAGA